MEKNDSRCIMSACKQVPEVGQIFLKSTIVYMHVTSYAQSLGSAVVLSSKVPDDHLRMD